jgi:phosphatidylglycerophosphatase A
MKKWVWLTISWFGVSGCFKRARGTWGTLATLPFAWVIQSMFGNLALFAAGVLLFILGTIASNEYVKSTGKQDPGEIVIDEVAATCMLLAYLPLTWKAYLAAFIVFRIFDVLKPYPVSVADQKFKGGFGVMFDDVLAALYPIAILTIIGVIKPEWTLWIMAWLS